MSSAFFFLYADPSFLSTYVIQSRGDTCPRCSSFFTRLLSLPLRLCSNHEVTHVLGILLPLRGSFLSLHVCDPITRRHVSSVFFLLHAASFLASTSMLQSRGDTCPRHSSSFTRLLHFSP